MYGKRHMLRRFRWFVLILGGALGLLSCATLPGPEQPDEAQPYARLVLPEAIRFVGLDTQTFDSRVRLREVRLTPGPHSLRFAYVGRSLAHAGQQPEPFRLEAQAGHEYVLEAKACGIIWRPAVFTHTLIPGYCTTHTCTEADRQVPPPIPRTPSCN